MVIKIFTCCCSTFTNLFHSVRCLRYPRVMGVLLTYSPNYINKYFDLITLKKTIINLN